MNRHSHMSVSQRRHFPLSWVLQSRQQPRWLAPQRRDAGGAFELDSWIFNSTATEKKNCLPQPPSVHREVKSCKCGEHKSLGKKNYHECLSLLYQKHIESLWRSTGQKRLRCHCLLSIRHHLWAPSDSNKEKHQEQLWHLPVPKG